MTGSRKGPVAESFASSGVIFEKSAVETRKTSG